MIQREHLNCTTSGRACQSVQRRCNHGSTD
nr:MAG TPA_asm: hypothetical protein [Caudoviricetes sp.]